MRSFPHVDGQWPTHLYIPVALTPSLSAVFAEAAGLLPHDPPFHALPSPFHLSLSHPFPLLSHQLQPFTVCLTRLLSRLSGGVVAVRGLRVYVNGARATSFGGVGVEDDGGVVGRLVRAANEGMREWGLPVYYDDRPSLHVTLAWAAGDVLSQLSQREGKQEEGAAGGGQSKEGGRQGEGEEEGRVEGGVAGRGGEGQRDARLDRATQLSAALEVSEVHLKTGNRITVIPLACGR